MTQQTGISGPNAHVEGGIHFHNYAPSEQVILNQCPAPEPCFLHRDEEIKWLNERLHPGKVVAVCGPGGMGKSALAAKAVHQLEPACFPDGIIFYSFDDKPSAQGAIAYIVHSYDEHQQDVSPDAARRLLANKQALLMLDGTEQAEDLPAILKLRGQCGVLITSRTNEDAPDALWELKPLDEQPAEEVFLRYSGPVDDLTSVRAICAVLKGWPVALRIAGRYLRNKKESAAAYLRWLEKKPFKMLGSGKHQEDNMALLLERSVAQVSADAVQALRLTGVLAFAPIGLGPVMAVLYKEGEEQDELELRSSYALGELVSFGLMEKGVKCWQINHALFHTYAHQELPLSKDTLERLVGAYVSFCRTQSEAGVKGYARLDAERAHCLRMMESCLNSGLWKEVKVLEGVIDTYLDRQCWWTDRLDAVEMRLIAARQADDRRDEGVCLNAFACICTKRGESEKALAYFEQSLPIRRELRDRQGEGMTLNNIAEIYRQQGKYELALGTYQQSLSIKREIADRKGEGVTLSNIALLYKEQGDYEQALIYYEQCLPIRQETGDKIGEGITLNNIATIYYAQGKPTKAMKHYEQALAIRRSQGDRAGEAESCWNIGRTSEDMGDLAKAEEYMSQAVQIEEAIGHPDLENDSKALAWVRAARRGQGNS